MEWSKFKIKIEPHAKGVLITDFKVSEVSVDESCYLLRGWNLGNAEHLAQLNSFLNISSSKGFVWALQQGHPDEKGRGINGETRRYLSLGRAYRPQPAWDVVVNNPGGQWYVVEARHEECLKIHGIAFLPEVGGGHNLRIERRDLAKSLDAIIASQDTSASDELDANRAEEKLKNDGTLSDTEKEEIIKARRGQGVFRRRVLATEAYCRLTGVSDPRFLRASHIKPWVDSDNRERLDGNNGLMLSPHVDHLFDGGFISFSQSGQVLVAAEIDSVLSDWSLPNKVIGSPFSDEQEIYLAFHRSQRFRGSE
jgi:hypothetical protein